MKLLHVTDLHFNKKQCAWISKNCGNTDLLCLTGDFLDDNYQQTTPISDQLNWLRSWLSKLSVPVLVCSGNHDQTADFTHCEWLRNLPLVLSDNSIAIFDGIRFGCIAYGEEEFGRFNHCHVLLHHEPPSGLKVAKQGKDDFGSLALRAAINIGELAPDWILSGHVHRPIKNLSRFRNIRISNPGANNLCDTPNHHFITIPSK